MTHDELDQIAARNPFIGYLYGAPSTFVWLSQAERDALLTLAREGLAARERTPERVLVICPMCDTRAWVRTDANWHHECPELNRLRLTNCLVCGQFMTHGHVCATPPTSGPDGVP